MTRVLLVDDEPNLTWTMAQFLSRQGYETDTASDYEGAVGILRAKKFDVAIVDIILPGRSGMDLLKRIAECDQSVSVVLMTGQPDIERIPEILRSGACNYLQKPVVKDTLIKAVSDAVDNKRRAEEKLLNDQIVRNHAARLEALLEERTGEMTRAAAQIAHEVKNPLAG
ncbi:MAG TPA: response regulator, partial [Blastocatellia bacterium]